MNERRNRLRALFAAAGLYGITDNEQSNGRSTVDVAAAMLGVGVKIIQYRDKSKMPGEKLADCRALRALTRTAGALFIVNDHPDLALLADADGVHIGQADYPPEAVRRLLGPDKFIGLSTHAPAQALAAEKDADVDYIGVGPLFATQTKKDVCAPVGLAYLDFVRRNTTLPFVAIGGVKEHNIGEVAAHGARTIAVVSGITRADDISAAVSRLFAHGRLDAGEKTDYISG